VWQTSSAMMRLDEREVLETGEELETDVELETGEHRRLVGS